MESNFSSADVYEFIKLIVEMGDVHYVDTNHCIFRKDDSTPVGVKIGHGKDSNKMICLFKEGCKPTPGSIYLNPFDESLGRHPERDWFFNVTSIVPGCMALYTMKSIVELINSKKKDAKFKTAQIISQFVDKVDDKFERELSKIRPLDVGMIFYDNSKHIAQLLVDFWDNDFEEKILGKIRKNSFNTMKEMLSVIYASENPYEYMHKGSLVACPKIDAMTHVLAEVLTKMTPVVEKLTDLKLHADELTAHVNQLPAYHKAMQWLATSSTTSATSTSETDAKLGNPTGVPWNVEAPGNSNPLGNVVAPGSTAGSGEKPFLSNVGPVGVTKNPSFGGGAVRNPNFGVGGVSASIFGGGGMGVPVTPVTPGLGRVAPVVPTMTPVDMSGMAAAAYNNLSFGSGFGGGFI